MIDFFSVVTEHKWCTEKKYMSFNSLLKFNHDASLLQTSWSLQDLCKNESLIVFAVRNVNVYVQNQKFWSYFCSLPEYQSLALLVWGQLGQDTQYISVSQKIPAQATG